MSSADPMRFRTECPSGGWPTLALLATLVATATACSSGGGMTPAGTRQIRTNIQGDFTIPSISLQTWEDVYVRRDTIAGVEDPDELYRQVLTVYGDMNIPITTVNADARLVGAVEKRMRRKLAGRRISKWLRCGSNMTGEIADRYEVRVTLVTQVETLEDGLELLTHMRGMASQGQVSGHAVRCTSEGRLEREFFQRVQLEAVGSG